MEKVDRKPGADVWFILYGLSRFAYVELVTYLLVC